MGNFIKFIVSKHLAIQLAASLIVTLAVIIGLVKYLDTYTLHGVRTQVPDLSEYHYTEIEGIMQDVQLRPIISDSVFTPEKKPGIILSQNPKAHTEVKPGRKVYITINSLTPPKVVLPALKDLTFRQARARVLSFGLSIDSVEYRPAECTNCVVDIKKDGEKIEAGTELDRGTAVTIIVGSGESEIKTRVPYLYGKKYDEAEKLLLSKGLNSGIIRYDETIENKEDSARAVIYRQKPEYGSENTINLGRSMDLFLTADSNKIPEIKRTNVDTLPEPEQIMPD